MQTISSFSMLQMQKLMPILALLEGLAIQRENVVLAMMREGQFVQVHFSGGMYIKTVNHPRMGCMWLLMGTDNEPVCVLS